jgi:acetyl-CoA C-acetyltransferase
MERAGIDFEDIHLQELYSCFPYAVRVQQHELGISGEGDLSVTGSMSFGGGPLNNFVYQATVKMAEMLRRQPGEVGLVTTVSSMMTKQGVALWSTEPNPGGWAFEDVTEAVRGSFDLREVVAEYTGRARVVGYTVLFQGASPWRAVAVFELPDGRRTVAFSETPEVMRQMMEEECCGRDYVLQAGQFEGGA